MSWQKNFEEELLQYKKNLIKNNFEGVAFRLNFPHLSLSEAILILKEMKHFLFGYEYAISLSKEKEHLTNLIDLDKLQNETIFLLFSLEKRFEENRNLLK